MRKTGEHNANCGMVSMCVCVLHGFIHVYVGV